MPQTSVEETVESSEPTAPPEPAEQTGPGSDNPTATDESASGGRSIPRPRARTWWRALGILTLLLAVGFATHAYRQAREVAHSTNDTRAAMALARQNLQILFEVNAQNQSDQLAQLRKVATGDFAEQLRSSGDLFAEIFDEDGISTQATLLESGTISQEAGQASVLAVVQVQITTPGKADRKTQVRVQVDLEKNGQEWLIGKIRGLA